MVYVRSHKFCCCLPVRFGVFVMSIGTLLLSGFVAVAAAITLKQNSLNNAALTGAMKTAVWILLVFYGIMALTSLFGFIGCLSRKRALVSIYSVVSWTLLILNIISGAISLYHVFHQDNSQSVNDCIQSVNDKTGTDVGLTGTACKDGVQVVSGVVKALTVGLQVVFWLIQLYGCHIISSYGSQLLEEEEAESRGAPGPSVVINNVAPQPAYAFTNGQNSYGKEDSYSKA